MDLVKTFNEHLFSIEGKTLGERQKCFRKILDELKSSNPTEDVLKMIAEGFQPRTKLEEAMKIDFFIEFRMANYLMEIFKCEKIYLIKKVIKEKWLFQEWFENVSPEMLDQFFSDVSYITRNLIINRLAALFRNTALADQYFDKIVQKYGLNEAINLLPCCSIAKIIECVKKYDIDISHKDLLALMKKDISIIESYIELKKNNIYPHKFCIDYLAIKYPQIYMKYYKKFFCVKLSVEATKVILKNNSADVYKDIPFFKRVMHENTMHRFFRNNLEAYCATYFPNDVKSWRFREPLISIIKHLSKEKQYELVKNTFMKQYGSDILKYPIQINEDLLKIMSEEDLAKIVLDENQTNDYFYFLPIDQALPIYMKKMNLTKDIWNRTKFLCNLIQGCVIRNKNTDALLKVLQYFNKRHRNDDSSLRYRFLSDIHQYFELHKLSAAHWEIINDIILVAQLNNDNNFEDLIAQIQLEKILMMMINNQSTDAEIKKYYEVGKPYYLDRVKIFKDGKYEKRFLLELYEFLPEDDEDLELYQKQLCQLFHDFNLRHPNEAVDLKDKYIDLYIKEWLEQKYVMFLPQLLEDYKTVKKYDLYKIVFKHTMRGVLSVKTLKQILIHEPDVMQTLLNAPMKIRGKNLNTLWKIMSKYEHMQLPQLYTKACLEFIKSDFNSIDTDTDYYVSKLPFRPIAFFSSTEEYINLMQCYIPNHDEKITNKKLLDRQEQAIKCVRFLSNLSQSFDFILKFCKGDFLGHALPALYCAVQRVKEDLTHEVLEKLSTEAVSVRKHVIHIATKYYCTKYRYNMLLNKGKSEKNMSVCKFILYASIRCFVRNPCEESLNIFASNCKIIDAEDEESFDFILENFNNIPKGFISWYFKIAWSAFDKACPKLQSKKYNMIRNLSADIVQTLDDEFCLSIIRDKLFEENYEINHYICEFTMIYLSCVNNEDIVSNKMNAIFKVMKDVLDKVKVKRETPILQSISSIIRSICTKAIRLKVKPMTSLLFLKLQTLGPLEDIYTETMIVEIAKSYMEYYEDDDFWDVFVENIFVIFHNLSHTSQYALFPVFIQVMEIILNMIDIPQKRQIFLETCAKNIDKSLHALLIINLMPTDLDDKHEHFTFYNNLMDKIEKHRDPVIRLLFKNAATHKFTIRRNVPL